MQRLSSSTTAVALHGRVATRTIESALAASLPAETLMQRAGEATARLALALAPHARQAWIAAGPGNNGGDGFEAARWLQTWGKQVSVSVFGDASKRSPDAQAALVRAQQAGVHVGAAMPALGRDDIAIDALLGIGASRAPTADMAAAIGQFNALANQRLAIDTPSGLDVDTGQPFGDDCINAHHTVALLTAKPGLFTAQGRDYAGTVWLDRLGRDDDERTAVDAWLIGTGFEASKKTVRRHATHKGKFGDVAVIGGAEGMVGSALLAAHAAHAAGAGRVFVSLLARDAQATGLDATRPELMFRNAWAASSSVEALTSTTTVCGCGGGGAVTASLLRLLSRVAKLVLDADALNAIAADATLAIALQTRAVRGLQTVLTPHPLEAARLLGCNTATVQADRLHAAHALAARYGAIVVLKGSGSVIAAPDRPSVIAATGNASLATAGTGDVLAGWIGGLWAQWPQPTTMDQSFESVVRAVVAHGAAAEPVRNGPVRAGDLIDALYQRA